MVSVLLAVLALPAAVVLGLAAAERFRVTVAHASGAPPLSLAWIAFGVGVLGALLALPSAAGGHRAPVLRWAGLTLAGTGVLVVLMTGLVIHAMS